MIDLFFTIGLFHYLILSLILFMTGLLGVLISRNMLRTVMSLFAVVINFVAFGCYCDNSLENANSISMFVLIIAVVQTIIALVILYKIYQANEYLDAEKIKDKEN